jgi:hypothetical protein
MFSVWVLFNDGQDKEVKEEEDQKTWMREIEKKRGLPCVCLSAVPRSLGGFAAAAWHESGKPTDDDGKREYSSKQERKRD